MHSCSVCSLAQWKSFKIAILLTQIRLVEIVNIVEKVSELQKVTLRYKVSIFKRME